MKRSVSDAKSGGKQARSTLSARRAVEAEDVRKRAADLKDQRVKQLVTTHRKKKQSRDAILTARAVDPKAMASGSGGTDRNGGGGGATTPPGMRSGSKPQTPRGEPDEVKASNEGRDRFSRGAWRSSERERAKEQEGDSRLRLERCASKSLSASMYAGRCGLSHATCRPSRGVFTLCSRVQVSR